MKKIYEIAIWAFIILLGIATLITQSIYFHAFMKIDEFTKSKYQALFALIFAVIAALIILIALNLYILDIKMKWVILIVLGVAFIFILISLALTMDDQNKLWKQFQELDANKKIILKESIGTEWYDALQIFPANLAFILGLGLPFVASSISFVLENSKKSTIRGTNE